MAEQASKVSGVVQIDGNPAQRTVRAFGYSATSHNIDGQAVDLSRSLGHAYSDPDTGEYTIDLLAGYGYEVFVVAFDDYGLDFAPDLNVAVGDRVHPTTPNGYVWECTSSGTLPTDEPTWIVDTETSQIYGTSSMIAKPFYRPMVHGPVKPVVMVVDTPTVNVSSFWRLYITENSGSETSYTAAMAEFKFFDANGTYFPATSGAVLFSSQNNTTSNSASNAFDDDVSNYWCSNGSDPLPQWIGYEFPEPLEVSAVTLESGPTSFFVQRMPITFDIQRSDDGVTWETVKSITADPTWTENETRTYSLTAS
ncbi:discoidin domain-containing protein [Marinobacter subterrani]|uniref:F5/8 type C domain n=1 Tax=Marinobacter subterrani TaxID=1658765 RepID=A0A0J7JAV7_9GAMM|nr:discoidin domain-containing protein [Marinobacter subterrani]KMQ75307.1 F5/8 type C domain [Marinobacter subterrani]